jgi:signal transduction histidine kinase
MQFPSSLRVRLALAAGLWAAIAMVAGFFVLSSIFRAHVTEQFYEELGVHVEELERLNSLEEGTTRTLQTRFSDPRYDLPLSGYYWEVRNAQGGRMASASLVGRRIGEIPEDDRQLGDLHSHRIAGPTGPLLLVELAVPSLTGELSYIVGTDERHLERAVGEFDRVLMVSLAGLGGVLVASVLGFVTFGLAPFNALARAMRRVRSGEVMSVEGRYPSEVQPLVNELNSMIVGQQESLQRARGHAGNLAHGLKAPLAIIADEAFQLEEKGEVSASGVIAEQCRAMQLHIDHHIARTRAQAMARTPGTRSDVGKTVTGVATALSRLHVGRGVALDCDVDPGLFCALDAQDLNELLANLVDNAFKFATSKIVIRASRTDGDVVKIAIEDDGPGLPPEAHEVVFSPGARLDETKSGTGLGLAIVRDLVELYRGKVVLGQSALGGLLVQLWLPVPAS